MRTLKKTLSLVLALVLCFGLVGTAFAANIEKYTDAEEVGAIYKEAVDVMMGLGVINGMTATEIGATGTLTREQAAKIIAYMVLGKTAADALSANAAPFKDVEADRWSAGYIAYCANDGILGGYGNGYFGPTDELTGYQFAKMLLCALGYGKAGEYNVGDSWSIAVAQEAIPMGIFAGDMTAAVNTPITRQQAMLMAFNCRDLTKVNYLDVLKIYSDTAYELTCFAGLAAAAVEGDDAFQRPTVKWMNANGTKVVAEVTEEPLAVYTNNFTARAAATAGFTGLDSATIYYNGGTGALTLADLTVPTVGTAVNGYTIELFGNPITKVVDEIVVSEGYFAVIGKATAAAGATPASLKVTVYEAGANAAGLEITVKDNTKNPADGYDKLAAYAEKAGVVVYLKNAWDLAAADATAYVLGVEATTAVAGTISAVNQGSYNCTSKVTVAGTTYACNNQFVGAKALTASATAAGTLYVDAKGVAIAWVANGPAAATNKSVVLTDTYTSLEGGKLVTKVDAVNANNETVTLVVTNDYSADLYKKVFDYATDRVTGISTLTEVTNTTVADAKTVKVANAQILATTKTLNGCYFDANVKFIYVDDTTGYETITVKNGVQLLSTQTVYTVIKTVGTTDYITAVYVMTAPTDGTITTSDIIYVAKQTGTQSVLIDNVATTVYTYDAYVNGVKVENFYSEDNAMSAGFYKSIKVEATGAYALSGNTYSTTGTTGVAADDASAYAAGILTVDSVDYDVAGATIVDLTATQTGLKATSTVAIIYNTLNNVASYVYIVA